MKHKLKASDVKIGSVEEAHWTTVVKSLEQTKRNLETELLFNDANLNIAKFQMEKAKREFKEKIKCTLPSSPTAQDKK